MSLECKKVKEYENYEYSDLVVKTFLKFKIPESDKKTNLITLEFCYDIKFIFDKYGFLSIEFYLPKVDWVTTTMSFSFDNIFQLSSVSDEYFQEISEYKLYSFNKEDFNLFLRKKGIKLKIENELDKELLYKFSADEINQINTSLNLIKYGPGKNLVYRKVIHCIEKEGQDRISIYDIVLFPLNTECGDPGGYLELNRPQQVIINQIKINNVVVEKRKKDEKKEEEEENSQPNEDKEKVVKGYYCSEEDYMKYAFVYKGTIVLFEFDCLGLYFYNRNYQINVNYFEYIYTSLIYGGSFRYEIIFNEDHKVKFPKKDFNLMKKDGKIILEGMIDGNKDNFNKEKFEELAKLYDSSSYINDENEENKMRHWMELKFMDAIPQSMEFVYND